MRSLPLFLLAVCLPSTIMAAGRHALILCNQNYTAVGALKTPLAEAKAAEETLKTLGFAGNITVVTDASTAKMTEVVDTFTSKLKDAEVALFFYGGHAIQAAGENYLLGVDSDPATTSQLAYKALPLGRVLTNLEGSGARLNLLILDCCRDNPLPTRGRNIGSTRGLAPTANAPKGTFIAYAADANQQAWDDHGQIGLYGSVLFEKMKTPGLRLEDIFIQTREEVSKIATEKYQHQQEPAEYSKVSGAFYFRLNLVSDQQQLRPMGVTPVLSPMAASPPATSDKPEQSKSSSVSSGSINVAATTLKLVSSDGETFQITQIKPTKYTKFVPVGESFGFERGNNDRFKLVSSSKKVVQHPELGALDTYVVKIMDSVSGKEFELVQRIETEVPQRR